MSYLTEIRNVKMLTSSGLAVYFGDLMVTTLPSTVLTGGEVQ